MVAEATDAFLQDWSSVKGFANPPWNLNSGQGSDEDIDPGSQYCLGCTSVDGATVVSPPASNAGRFSMPPSLPSGRGGSFQAPTGRLEHLRKKLRDQHLSVQATEDKDKQVLQLTLWTKASLVYGTGFRSLFRSCE